MHIGFTQQSFSSQVTAEIAFVRRDQKVREVITQESVPASSKKELELAKFEPTSNAACTSVRAYLRKGKKILCDSIWKRGLRQFEVNNHADSKVSEEGGGVGVLGAATEVSLQSKEPRWSSPLQLMVHNFRADLHGTAQSGEGV